MFDAWRRPAQTLPGQRDGAVTSIVFDPIEQIAQIEGWGLVASLLARDRRYLAFLHGLNLARELELLRATKTYADKLQVVLTVLFVKTLNDLLGACLLMRAGYSLQAYPLLRSALESSEMMEYLTRNRESLDDYVRGAERFDRDLSWVRAELPATQTRKKAYGTFNYYTHSNFKGLNIYTTYDASPKVVAAQVGPIEHPVQIVPFVFATTVLAYATRTIWESDRAAATADWVAQFRAFDRSTGNSFADVTDSNQ